ncbi:MAG: transposase [Gammaproteobacteria bacterium]|nr:transposase [Gammaproteobacteria bacterium]
MTRSVETEVLERFLDCGDLHQGFARIYCDQCGHDYLLAYSCKTRYFCPSCHQKRMLAYGEWIEEQILAPVPHRQYVFALPRLVRPYFRYHRAYHGQLCRLVADLLRTGFTTMMPGGQPAFILYVQTFGDLVTFNPHIHALVADGVFMPSGTFRVLPPLASDVLTEALRHKVLACLCAEGRLDPDMVGRMLKWRHSGFSVHNQVRVQAGDADGRRRLARYMIRNPFALAKMTYDPKTTMVIYRSQLHATLKRNYQLMPALKWLRLLLNHVPDKYEHLVRYYGYYSNRSRGARRLAEPQGEQHVQVTVDDRPPDRRCKATWARLIQKVYEVDPLECPNCGATMRIIALIDEPTAIERILKHLKVWDPGPAPIQPAGRDPPWPQGENLPLTYHPVPDIA